MALTSAEIYDLYTAGKITRRVIVFVAAAVFTILTEDPATANHAQRVAWAKAVAGNIEGEANRFVWCVLGSPTVLQLGDTVDDSSLAYIVNQLIAVFVGV